MTMPPPDTFDTPAHQEQWSARITPPAMGGATPITPALAGRMIRRRPAEPGVDRAMSSAVDRIRQQSRRRIVRLNAFAQAVGGQVTLLVPQPGGPTRGFQWDLRRLNVGPIDYSAGSFPSGIETIALIGPQEEPGLPADSAAQVISATAAYPAEGTWSRGQVTLLPGDHIRVLVTGLANGVFVSLGGQCEEVAIDTTITAYGL